MRHDAELTVLGGKHHSTGPGQFRNAKFLAFLQGGNQGSDFFGMTIGPIRLWKHVIYDVDPARVQQFKRFFE